MAQKQKNVNNLCKFKPKVNLDKVRYEWGGCIYAGWCISSLEMVLCLVIWWQRGFAEERKEEKDKEAAQDSQ